MTREIECVCGFTDAFAPTGACMGDIEFGGLCFECGRSLKLLLAAAAPPKTKKKKSSR